jgi:hypothetical protein
VVKWLRKGRIQLKNLLDEIGKFNSEIQNLVGAPFMAGRNNGCSTLIAKSIKINLVGNLLAI